MVLSPSSKKKFLKSRTSFSASTLHEHRHKVSSIIFPLIVKVKHDKSFFFLKELRMKKPSNKSVSFSTTLSKQTKELLERYCDKKGLRMNHVVERAILELLEDEMDKEIIESRELE